MRWFTVVTKAKYGAQELHNSRERPALWPLLLDDAHESSEGNRDVEPEPPIFNIRIDGEFRRNSGLNEHCSS
jgi:hypothetical protein